MVVEKKVMEIEATIIGSMFINIIFSSQWTLVSLNSMGPKDQCSVLKETVHVSSEVKLRKEVTHCSDVSL